MQTLSHVKEKLQYYLAQNDKQKQNLSVYDEQVKKVGIITLNLQTLDHVFNEKYLNKSRLETC